MAYEDSCALCGKEFDNHEDLVKHLIRRHRVKGNDSKVGGPHE